MDEFIKLLDPAYELIQYRIKEDKVIFKHLISAAIMVGGFIGIARVIRPSGWIGLIVSAIIMCISGLIIHVLIMCNMDEKLFLIKKITKRK